MISSLSKWVRQEFQVATTPQYKAQGYGDKVKGLVCGPFGIDHRDSERFNPWILTHLPSGTRIHRYEDVEAAKAAVTRLSTMDVDWTSPDPLHGKDEDWIRENYLSLL